MEDTYRISIVGLERTLPLRTVAPGVRIAFFQLLGDTELCEAIALHFTTIVDYDCDYIVTPELKAVPLAHELSRGCGPLLPSREQTSPGSRRTVQGGG